jgi:hypothetical protein
MEAPKQITMENPLNPPIGSHQEPIEENKEDIHSCVCCMYCSWFISGLCGAIATV